MFASLAGVLFDGFAYGMLLFLLSVGLSVTLGMMNFVNLAHCSFAMIGGYVAVTLVNSFGWPFLASLPIAFLAAALVSIVLERALYRRLYRATDLDQCLFTIGIVFISVAVAAYFYGTVQQPISTPPYLRGSVQLMGMSFAAYRLFLIVTALAIAASLGVAVAAGGQQGKGNYVTAEVLRTTSNIFLGLGLQLAFIASVNGFGRDLEREADREGMDRMVKAGYDPREAPRVFALLKDDHGDGSKLENFFFGNHPRLDERIANTQEMLKTKYAHTEPAEGLANNDEFAMRTRTVVRENAALDIRAGRFGLAKASSIGSSLSPPRIRPPISTMATSTGSRPSAPGTRTTSPCSWPRPSRRTSRQRPSTRPSPTPSARWASSTIRAGRVTRPGSLPQVPRPQARRA